jgi:hypothetical protein
MREEGLASSLLRDVEAGGEGEEGKRDGNLPVLLMGIKVDWKREDGGEKHGKKE